MFLCELFKKMEINHGNKAMEALAKVRTKRNKYIKDNPFNPLRGVKVTSNEKFEKCFCFLKALFLIFYLDTCKLPC